MVLDLVLNSVWKFPAVIVLVLLHGPTTCTLTKSMKKKLGGNHEKMFACSFEQILEAALHKTATVWLFTTHLTNHLGETSQRSMNEFISNVFLWTPIHGHSSVGQLVKTYIHQLCVDTGWRLLMDKRDK